MAKTWKFIDVEPEQYMLSSEGDMICMGEAGRILSEQSHKIEQLYELVKIQDGMIYDKDEKGKKELARNIRLVHAKPKIRFYG